MCKIDLSPKSIPYKPSLIKSLRVSRHFWCEPTQTENCKEPHYNVYNVGAVSHQKYRDSWGSIFFKSTFTPVITLKCDWEIRHRKHCLPGLTVSMTVQCQKMKKASEYKRGLSSRKAIKLYSMYKVNPVFFCFAPYLSQMWFDFSPQYVNLEFSNPPKIDL